MSQEKYDKKLGVVHFFFDLKLDNIQIEIYRKNFIRAQNPVVEKKTLGQDFSIGSSLYQIRLTRAEK